MTEKLIFPIAHCIRTKDIPVDLMYSFLLKLVNDGYHLPSKLDRQENPYYWNFIGVNHFGSIILYDQATSYLPGGELPLGRKLEEVILSREWLLKYIS